MNFSSLMIYTFVNLITPGPNNIMSMYAAAQQGLKGAKGFLFGAVSGYSAKMLLCGLLNMVLSSVIPGIMPYARFVGAAYLLYLAIAIVWPKKNKPGEQTAKAATFSSGILMQCLNVKSWVFGLTYFTVYVTPFGTAFPTILIFSLLSVAVMVACTLCWALFGSAMKRFYARYGLIFNIVMAALLIYCAVTILL